MFVEHNRPEIQSNLNYSVGYRIHQKKILVFLRTRLPMFAGEYFKKPAPEGDISDNEDYISGELSDFLNSVSEGYIFRFNAKKGVDLSIRVKPFQIHSCPILLIEAKRLPPTSSRDYVQTGIGRFKREEHGKQHKIAVMLGYVQKNSFAHWHGKVNSWVDVLTSKPHARIKWTAEDKIRKEQIGDIGEYISDHSRITQSPIILHHFWIDLCVKR